MPKRNLKKLTKRQQELVVSCYRLAYLEAIRHHRRFPEMEIEDCLSQAMEGLCYAARAFKKKMGFQFTTYAVITIRNRYVYNWRHLQIAKRRCPTKVRLASELERHHRHGSGEPEESADWWAGSCTDPAINDWLDQVKKYCHKQDWDLLEKRYLHGWIYRDIAREMGVTTERVRQKIGKILKRLRERVPNPDKEMAL